MIQEAMFLEQGHPLWPKYPFLWSDQAQGEPRCPETQWSIVRAQGKPTQGHFHKQLVWWG